MLRAPLAESAYAPASEAGWSGFKSRVGHQFVRVSGGCSRTAPAWRPGKRNVLLQLGCGKCLPPPLAFASRCESAILHRGVRAAAEGVWVSCAGVAQARQSATAPPSEMRVRPSPAAPSNCSTSGEVTGLSTRRGGFESRAVHQHRGRSSIARASRLASGRLWVEVPSSPADQGRQTRKVRARSRKPTEPSGLAFDSTCLPPGPVSL